MSNHFSLRPATDSDTPAVFRLFLRSIRDLAFRQGTRLVNDGHDPEVIDAIWPLRRPMFEHLAQTAHRFWVAEHDGEILGYARSILRDGMLELTEFFVAPKAQSGGMGRELLRHVFNAGDARLRSIIASTDVRAQARYLKTGVYPQFPIYHFSRKPEEFQMDSGLRFEPMSNSDSTLHILGDLDAAVLGYRRDVDHRWFLGNRSGFLAYHGDKPVGYGYVSRGYGSGPFALLDADHYPPMLAHAETLAASSGLGEFVLHVPMVNRTAVDYLLGTGYRLDPSFMFYMSDTEVGLMDRYLITSPPLFM